jgi:glycerophosphoryl diester phosphodiesterase
MSISGRGALLYGHRGASAELPENTLAAFARALELGADAIESDIHLTRDGHVVLSHDPDGRRMADQPQAIRETTLAELRTWDVGWGYVDARGERPFAEQGHRMPTLPEALEALGEVPLNLDIKQTSPRMVEPLLKVLRAFKAEERVQLASFSQSNLDAVLAAGYRGAVALGRDELIKLFFVPGGLLKGWSALKTSPRRAQIPTSAGPLSLDSERFLTKCHKLSIAVDYWTINEPDDARRLVALGADGIMTDDVAAVAPALKG